VGKIDPMKVMGDFSWRGLFFVRIKERCVFRR